MAFADLSVSDCPTMRALFGASSQGCGADLLLPGNGQVGEDS
jgi:hypothetical protein